MNYTAAVRKTPPHQPVLFSLYDGRRPASLSESLGPQERVQRHTMEHIVDFVYFAPMVQILDALVPQSVEQLPDILHYFLFGFVPGSHTSCVWVLPVENPRLNFSGDSVVIRATLGSTVNTCSASVRDASGRISHISTLTWTRILWRRLHSHAEWRSVLS